MHLKGLIMSDTWVCIASGPSLTREDVEYCRAKGWNLAAVNTSWLLAKDAKIIYAADYRWWEEYHEDVKREAPQARMLTASSTAAKHFGLEHVHLYPGGGFSIKDGYAYSGGLSGHQLIQVVGWQKPSRIILLGYDMHHTGGKAHWHGNHPNGWPNAPNLADELNSKQRENYEKQMNSFVKLAEQATVPIINCTRDTRLECFERAKLIDL